MDRGGGRGALSRQRNKGARSRRHPPERATAYSTQVGRKYKTPLIVMQTKNTVHV